MCSLDKFKAGDVILLEDLLQEGLTPGEVQNLVDNGELCQYEVFDEVFYLNKSIEIWGRKEVVKPLADAVISRYFIGDDFKFGYWGEFSLLNRLAICNQTTLEVVVYTSRVVTDEEFVLDNTAYKLYPRAVEFGGYLLNLIFNKYPGWVDCTLTELMQVLLKYVSLCELQNYSVNIENSNGMTLFSEVIKNVFT